MFVELKDFDKRPVSFDYSSSGQGLLNTMELLGNSQVLINNLRSFEIERGVFQAIICTHCGIVNCEPGSWLSIRKKGGDVVLIPAVLRMRTGEREITEYGPPTFIRKHGPMVMSRDVYEDLRKQVPAFPGFEALCPISVLEVLYCHQLTVPGRVLGLIGDYPKIDTDKFLAVSEGDLNFDLESLRVVLIAAYNGMNDCFSFTPDKVVEFHLDLPGFPTWKGLAYKDDRPVLVC